MVNEGTELAIGLYTIRYDMDADYWAVYEDGKKVYWSGDNIIDAVIWAVAESQYGFEWQDREVLFWDLQDCRLVP